MAKKYLSIDEAAAQLGISTDELTQLREKGEVRGFADRGTWKFKADDVENLSRSREADSDPDVQLLGGKNVLDETGSDAGMSDEAGSSVVLGDDPGSSVEMQGEDALGQQPTMVSKSSPEDSDMLSGSDSDVRLILDDSLQAETGEKDSDSDVQLTDDVDSTVDTGSDSDVKLVGSDSDSDVELAPDEAEPDSDSDVKLAAGSEAAGSDSDVKLINQDTESDVAQVGAGDSISDVALVSGAAAESLKEDSEVSLGSGSGINLEGPADSGISLETGDSGISLDLTDDSGISLDDSDDGITLAEDSGVVAGPEDDASRTIPMMDAVDYADSPEETSMEIPAFVAEDESDFDLDTVEGSTDTNVLMFDEEGGEAAVADEFMDDEFGEEFGEEDLEADVFDAGDEDFEQFEEGESHPDFAVAGMPRVAAPAAADWGGMMFGVLAFSTVLMAACLLVSYDLVRTMWQHQDLYPVSSLLIDTIGGLF